MHLRLQGFKSISDYNSVLFKISSQLKLCGENITEDDMLEKTFTTFHASNVLLEQQYRERRFTKYSELISCLLVAEQNNEFLLKTINLIILDICHCLKPMPHMFKILDMDKDVDMDEVDVENVIIVKVVVNTILLIIVVLKVKKKTTQTTKSGIIQRHNLKRG